MHAIGCSGHQRHYKNGWHTDMANVY